MRKRKMWCRMISMMLACLLVVIELAGHQAYRLKAAKTTVYEETFGGGV